MNPKMNFPQALLYLFLVCVSAWSKEGILRVITEPEGIEVWLEGAFIGNSPIHNKKVPPGHYTLKLVDPIQRISLTEEIEIEAGRSVTLEKKVLGRYGSLQVDSDPANAEVLLRTSLGRTPLKNDYMNPGKYRLEIATPDRRHTTHVEDIVITRGGTVALNKTLARKKLLHRKALIRLALGTGAIAGFSWALVSHGQNREYFERAKNQTGTAKTALDSHAHWARMRRNAGIIIGVIGVAGFEIVAFF